MFEDLTELVGAFRWDIGDAVAKVIWVKVAGDDKDVEGLGSEVFTQDGFELCSDEVDSFGRVGGHMVKVLEYSVIHFEEDFKDERGRVVKRPVILIYALGEDGVIYEMSGGKWLALPISAGMMRELTPGPKPAAS